MEGNNIERDCYADGSDGETWVNGALCFDPDLPVDMKQTHWSCDGFDVTTLKSHFPVPPKYLVFRYSDFAQREWPETGHGWRRRWRSYLCRLAVYYFQWRTALKRARIIPGHQAREKKRNSRSRWKRRRRVWETRSPRDGKYRPYW